MKTYENLTGAAGKEIFYRAERFRARDLFPRALPRVLIGGRPHHLENLSISGIAASAARANSAIPLPGDEVQVVLEDDSGMLFSGRGHLRRVEDRSLDTLVALSFKGTSLDIAGLVNRHSETLIQRELNGGLSHALDEVPEDYRRFSADVVHLLRAYRTTLTKFETAASDRDGAFVDPARFQAIYHAAEERMLPEWRKLWHEGNAIVRPLMGSSHAVASIKAFTERVLTPEFMGGAIWNRSYRKPLGYPGDFEMMNYVYEWQLRGGTVFEKLVHRIGLDVAECIATRMVMVQQYIAEAVAQRAAAQNRVPLRVLSLGCGPAQEIYNYLSVRKIPGPVSVTLVDQDRDAINCAYRRAYPLMMKHDNGSSLHCLQVSFIDLMKAGRAFATLPAQDLIYSVGLVDYLSMRRIQGLVRSLYDKLAPGGTVVIGNMADVPGSNLWPMEFLCDWTLHYRTEEQMAEMAAGLNGAIVEVRPDPTGRVFMVYITKTKAA
jgi:extracellular factor (EF) 3-hydroxypalmitic acid methyl ester biosynthesis protein